MVIVLYKGEVENVTSRERSKYLMHAKVYELAVEVPKSKIKKWRLKNIPIKPRKKWAKS
jgi:hypothetical protein